MSVYGVSSSSVLFGMWVGAAKCRLCGGNILRFIDHSNRSIVTYTPPQPCQMEYVKDLADKAKFGIELEKLKFEKGNLEKKLEKIETQKVLYDESKLDKEELHAMLKYYHDQKAVYTAKITELPEDKKGFLPVFQAVVKDFVDLIESLTMNLEHMKSLTGDMDDTTFALEKSCNEKEMHRVNESLSAVRDIVHTDDKKA